MWTAIQGVGLADTVWSGFMSTDGIKQIAAASIAAPDSKKLGYDIFNSLSCVYAHEKIKSEVAKESNDILKASLSSFGVSVETGVFGTTFKFGDKNEKNTYKKDSCGVVTIAKFSSFAIPQSSGIFTQIIDAKEALTTMVEANKKNVEFTTQLITAIAPIAEKQTSGTEAIDLSGVEQAIAAYQKSVVDSATEVLLAKSNNEALQKAATQDGWITAGLFFNKLTALQDLAQRSASAVPESSGPKVFQKTFLSDRVATIMTGVQDSLNKSGAPLSLGYGVSKLESGTETSWTDTIWQSIKRGFDMQIILKKIVGNSIKFFINDKENVFLQSERIGGYLLGAASGIATGLFAVNAVAGLDPGIAANIASVAVIFLPPMFLAGALLKYVIPMLPALIYWGAVVGWAVLVCEALVGSPLWAIMHMTPEGHDMVGQGHAGYKLVLSLTLRPVFIIFGFILALVLSQVIGMMINATFADTWISAQGDDNVFLLMIGTLIFMPLIYFGFMLMFLKKCLSLIHIVPDQILRWITGSADQMGHFAQSMVSGEALAGAMAGSRIAGQVGGTIGNALSKSAQENAPSIANKEMGQMRDGFANAAMKEEGGSESLSDMKKSQAESKFNNAVEMAGGADSAQGKEFAQNLTQSMKDNPAKSSDEHIASALNTSLNQQYGRGTGAIAGNMGGGYSGDGFKSAVGMYKETSQALSNSGMSPAAVKGAISKANSQAYSDYKNNPESSRNGGEKGIGDYASARLSALKDSAEPKLD